MSNVPKLRFKEFSGEWEEKKLGELADISSGGTPLRNKPSYWNGTIPWVTTSLIDFRDICSAEEYITEEGLNNSSAKLFEKNTILMAMYGQGKTRGKVGILKLSATTNQACASINPKSIDYIFLYQYLMNQYDNIRNLSNEGGQKNLSGPIIKNILIPYPSKQEQEKIASFLTLVDTKIEQLTKKEALLSSYKKGVMQKIFSGEIRFKADDGSEFCDWEETTVETHFNVGSSKRVLQQDWTTEGVPFYRTRELVSLAKNEPFSSEIFISQELFSELVDKYGIPKDGDFLVSGVGTLGIYYQVKPTDKFYFKDGNVLWFKRKPTIISDFFKYCFESDYVQNQIVAQASTTTVGTYTIQNAKKTKLFVPSNLAEQTKIANFLSSIDTKIEQVQKQLDSTKEFKKALLQQMFV